MKGIPFTSEMMKAIRNTEIGRWPPFPIDVTGAFKGVTRRLVGKSQYKIGCTYSVEEEGVPVGEFVRIVKIAKSRLGDMKPMDYVYEGLLVTNDQMNQLYLGGWDGSNELDEYKKVWVGLWEAINGQGSYHTGVSVVEYWFKRLRCESDPKGQA